MNKGPELTRRQFVQTAGAAAAAYGFFKSMLL